MALRSKTAGESSRWRRYGRGFMPLAAAALLACADGPAPPSRAGTVPALAAVPGRTSALEPAEPAPGLAGKAAVTLDLSLEKTAVVAGESVPFTLTVRNNGSLAITVPQPSSESPVFSIRVTSLSGFSGAGDALSLAAREGERTEPSRSPRTASLAPGATTTLRGDVVAWIGGLDPGSYSIAASWQGSPSAPAESKRVEFLVAPAAPVHLREGGRNVFLARVARDAAWIQHGSAGYELYLLRSSPWSPDVVRSNRRLVPLDGPVDAVPASFNSGALDARAVAWIEGGATLRVLRVPDDGSKPTSRSIRLPAAGMSLVEPPFVDEGGAFLAVIAGRDGKSAVLVRATGDGAASFTPFRLPFPMGAQRAALWAPDGALTVAWTAASGGDVHAASVRLASIPAEIETRRLASLAGKPAALRLACRSRESDEGYDTLLFALARDGSSLVETRIDAVSGKAEGERRTPWGASAEIKVLDAVVGQDLAARYLLAGSSGEVSILYATAGGIAPVRDAAGKRVRDSASPQLVLAWRPGAKVSTWIRYMDSGGRIAAVKAP